MSPEAGGQSHPEVIGVSNPGIYAHAQQQQHTGTPCAHHQVRSLKTDQSVNTASKEHWMLRSSVGANRFEGRVGVVVVEVLGLLRQGLVLVLKVGGGGSKFRWW